MKRTLSLLHSGLQLSTGRLNEPAYFGFSRHGLGFELVGGAGEDGEQFFAYLSQFAHTTRNMSVAGSNDVLTSAALFFARNKLAGQAELLVCRYNKYKAVLEAALPKLVARVQELLPAALSPEQHADVVHQLHKELQQLAMEWRDEANKRHGGRQHDSILHHFAAAVRQRDALHAQQLTNHDIVSRGDRAELAAARVIAAVADPQLAQVRGHHRDDEEGR